MRGANGIGTTWDGRWRRSARMLHVAVGLLILGQLVPANATAAQGPPGLRFLGLLPPPLAGTKNVGQDCNIAQIDPAGRRLYVLCTNFSFPKAYLTEYDISKPVPVPMRSVPALPAADIPGSISPYDTAFDGSRHRLLLLATNNTGASVVHVIDLASLKQTGSWDLSRAAPGFAALGMTYAPRDGRVYLVGDMSGSPALASGVLGSKVIGPATSVVALDARTGKLAWIRPVPQCQQVLLTLGTGALIARSSFQPALYFFCSTGGSLPPLSPYPGEAGVVRLTITNTTSENKALHFPVVFFPISGSYTNGNQTGIAAFDPGSDRFFTQSLADSNPGAWVFDGRMSAWVGFIAAPHSDDFYLGIDSASGHYYMGGDASTSKGWVLVSDSRVTPVPQGQVFPYIAKSFIAVDPVTHRLFAKVVSKPGDSRLKYAVFEDNTPQAQPPQPANYDGQTANVPEGPHTITTFAGDVDGYGAKLQAVGGLSFGTGFNPPGLTSGDRGLMAARVASLDLREVGASASAQAGVPDNASEGDRGGLQSSVQGSPGAPAAGLLDWPWTPATCLDSGSGMPPQSKSGAGGNSRVECNLAKSTDKASSSLGAIKASFPGGEVSVASTGFSTIAQRDPRLGVVTQTAAEASGVVVSAKKGGEISISRAVARAVTTAQGRPGTTFARWSRLLEGVVVRNASGKVVYERNRCTTVLQQAEGRVRSASTGDCGGMARAIDNALQTRMRLDLPLPRITATPKGAFAGVQQTAADYYQDQTVYHQGVAFLSDSVGQQPVPALQLAVFNDGGGQSRLLLQLAAIQASSIYTISLVSPSSLGGAPPAAPPTGGNQAPPTKAPGGIKPTGIGGNPGSTQVIQPVSPPTSAGGSFVGVLIHSPGEALMMAGMWLLFIAAGVSIARRRTLLDALRKRGA